MIIGNPSSNKTQLVSLVRNASDTIFLDALTANPFVSGMSKKENPQDLLPKLDGTCLVIKDYTTFFGRSDETVKQLLSDMVSIYDGDYAKFSGARGMISYKSSFAHIGCVTPMGISKRQRYMNMVGARFLTMRIPPLTTEQRDSCFEIAWSKEFKKRVGTASELATQFVDSINETLRHEGVNITEVDAPLQKKLNVLSELVARARGEVETRAVSFEGDDGERKTYDEIVDIQIEEPFRALHQLRALAKCLAIIRGKDEVTADEINTVHRIALSSMPVNCSDALAIFKKEDRVSALEGSEISGKNYKTVKRHLDRLVHLKVLKRQKDTDGKTWIYEPDSKFKSIITSEINTELPC